MVDMTSSGGPIAAVREDMRVVDSTGKELGKVTDVRMSDPGAVTTEGQGTGSGGVLQDLAALFGGGSDLSEHQQERLVRLGYVRVDAKGIFSGDRYVASDEIAEVSGDTVTLSVPGDRLVG